MFWGIYYYFLYHYTPSFCLYSCIPLKNKFVIKQQNAAQRHQNRHIVNSCARKQVYRKWEIKREKEILFSATMRLRKHDPFTKQL